jgi:hypothetical protein
MAKLSMIAKAFINLADLKCRSKLRESTVHMKQDKSCIKRKIYFYKINAGRNSAGKPIDYDVKSVLEAIDGLSFQTDARYLKDEDGFEICCLIDELSSPQKVRFCKIRRDDFPQIEHRGNLADLEIPEESGLAECVHVIFFPENIVGLEYNYDGPRTARISDYLYAKAKNISAKTPVFEQLLQQDAIAKLEHMRTVRRFSLKIRESLFSSVKQADESLASAFQAARDLGQASEIELILSVGRRKGTLGTKVLDVAKRLLILRDTNNDLIGGEIKGYNDAGNIEIIDLLNAKLVTEKCIPRHRARTSVPRSELVYAAIEEAYNELKDQFPIALGVTVCIV